MRLRIVSDGTPLGTEFLDALTGDRVEIQASRVTWELEAGDMSKMIIEVPMAGIDAIVDCPDYSLQLELKFDP